MKRIISSLVLLVLGNAMLVLGYSQYWSQLLPENAYDQTNSPGVAMIYYIATTDFNFQYDEQTLILKVSRKDNPQKILNLNLMSIDESTRSIIMDGWTRLGDQYILPDSCKYMSFYTTVSFGENYKSINDTTPTRNKHDFSASQGISCKPTLPLAGPDLIQLID
jgi:hypothetical protein